MEKTEMNKHIQKILMKIQMMIYMKQKNLIRAELQKYMG